MIAIFSWLFAGFLFATSVSDQSLQDQIAELKHLVSHLQDEITEIKSGKPSQSATTIPAFSAYSTDNEYYTPGQKIIFDDTFLNNGDHYEPESGTFTCPVHGYYSFSWSLYSDASTTKAIGNLMINDVMYGRVNGYGDWQQATNVQILECQSGDSVWIRSAEPAVIAAAITSTFSGYLVQQIF